MLVWRSKQCPLDREQEGIFHAFMQAVQQIYYAPDQFCQASQTPVCTVDKMPLTWSPVEAAAG